ncbi:MAG: DEAD/DEAH box helicase [Ardenticatenia bacterium]|nr:DEAD/DEAH box helicase [Ardenticatenia bacterium]
MNVRRFLDGLRASGYGRRIVHIEEMPPRAARYAQLSTPLPAALRETLGRQGVSCFYTHQVQAIELALKGRDVVVATGTASGKTLCYNVPVLVRLLEDFRRRALYLFPTKALAQDQLRALGELTDHPLLRRVVFATYDGDTPRHVRGRLRRRAHIVLTNPDMLHVGILPNHQRWSAFFSRLTYVVIDEAHAYRGVFGSHVACLLRRLWRLCALYGARPTVVAASATIGNPREHVERLTGRRVDVVSQDGGPRGRRTLCCGTRPA